VNEVPPWPIVPLPASQFSTLRGKRVIVGVPGLAFRGELRADDPVVHGSRTFVPVLTEQDYYRAEIDQLEVFAPLVPVERVWVEHPGPLGADTPKTHTTALDSPPHRLPTPARDVRRITGMRVVQAVPDGHVRDLRAVTDTYEDGPGDLWARICSEPDWHAWALTGTTPTSTRISADLLWVE
jgi:hypothetical protein